MITRENLPDPGVRAHGHWVLLMVEPPEQESDIIHLVRGNIDAGTDLGFAWVLSAADTYYDQHPDKEQKKAPKYEDKTCVMRMPVKRGDKVIFRRFLRSQGLMQGKAVDFTELEKQFPDHEIFFISVNDIYGIVEDEPEEGNTTTHSDRPVPQGISEEVG